MPRLVLGIVREAYEATTKLERFKVSRSLRRIAAEQLRQLGMEVSADDISARWIVYDDSDNEATLEVDILFSVEEASKIASETLAGISTKVRVGLNREELIKPEFKDAGVWVMPQRGAVYTGGMIG